MSRGWLVAALGLGLLACGGGDGAGLRDGGAEQGALDMRPADAAPTDLGPADQAVDAAMGADVPVRCTAWAAPEAVGPSGDGLLLEASGLVSGRVDPSRLWLHNDSGDDAVLYTLSTQDGGALGRYLLLGVDAVDFEDIAAGGCPGEPERPCLWVGDIGDNGRQRASIRVHVVPEPAADASPGPLRPLGTITLQYPDGAHDAEALLVSADGERLWLIDKGGEGGASQVFEAQGPFDFQAPVQLVARSRFTAPGVLVTGADLRADGRQVLVRTYTGTTAYDLAVGQTPGDLGEARTRTAANGPLSERQGEAVGYGADGLTFWTVSEVRGSDEPPDVNRYGCEETEPLTP